MNRRDFITLLGSAAATWPSAAGAQQPAMPVIGFLGLSFADTSADSLRGFRQGLRETGFIENENVAIEYRWAENEIDRVPVLATDLARRQVSVIVTFGGSTFAAKAATATIPIVFAVSADPVRLGLVASLARPGGNLTGINFFNTELASKRLELLRELVPAAARIGVLANPTGPPDVETILQDVQAAARVMGLQIQVFNASTSREINAVFATFAQDRPDALFIAPDPFFLSRRLQLAMQAARHAIPAIFASRAYVTAGGLISYGANFTVTYRQLGVYAGRILKGAKPADLPVVQSSKFELVINAETGRLLGLDVPETLLARADEVIE
jgi:putative tryptophan/tyrosine transport system substrate-binding protein